MTEMDPIEQVYAGILHRLRTHRAALAVAAQAQQHDHDQRLDPMVRATMARQDEALECLAIVADVLGGDAAAVVPANQRPIRLGGGLLACCVATLEASTAPTRVGDTLSCAHEGADPDGLIVAPDGAWVWNH